MASADFEGTLTGFTYSKWQSYGDNSNNIDQTSTQYVHSGSQAAKVTSSTEIYSGTTVIASNATAKYYRGYFRLSALPSNSATLIGSTAGDGFGFAGRGVVVTSAGELALWTDSVIASYYTDGGDFVNSGSGVVPTGSWFRLEAFLGGTSVWQVKLFTGANVEGATPDVHLTGGAATLSNDMTGAFGQIGNAGTFAAFHMDDLATSNTGWIGPLDGGASTYKHGVGISRY